MYITKQFYQIHLIDVIRYWPLESEFINVLK